MNKKLLQRVLIVAFGSAFVVSTGAVIIGSLLSRDSAVANYPAAETADPLEQLKAQASGYEKVLAREPNNLNALIELTRIRQAIGDFEGAIDPLDKLIAMYPEDPNLAALRTQIQQELENQTTEAESTTSESEN